MGKLPNTQSKSRGDLGGQRPIQHDLSLSRTDRREREEREEVPLSLGIFKRLFGYTKPHRKLLNTLFFVVLMRAIQLPILAWMIGAIIGGPIQDLFDLSNAQRIMETEPARIIERHDPATFSEKVEEQPFFAEELLAANTLEEATVVLEAAESQAWSRFIWSVLGFLAFAAFTQITMYYRALFSMTLGERVIYDLRNLTFEALIRQPMGYFSKTRLGSHISRMTSDIEALRAGVQNVLFIFMVQAGQMIGAAFFMCLANWQLFLIILGMAPMLVGINWYFRRRISRASRALQESYSRVTASLAETVKGIRVTQGFVREQRNAGIFSRLVADHSEYNLGMARNQAIYIPLLELNSQFFLASILLVGGYGVLQPGWNMEIGDLVSFFFLANLFFDPIAGLGRQFSVALSAMAGAERVFRVIDNKPAWEDAPDAKELPPVKGRVEFQDVDFSYDPGKPVLKQVNLTAEPGEMVALVGHTGSGKSTIINLLTKFYIPTAGSVRIDGHDLADITGESLHAQMGIVLQENFLFSGTVMENIRLGRLDATDDEVRAAVGGIDCLDLLESLPDGLDTVVAERGSGLSLGQRQIVCFARAMLADPRILILDEATSSIDTITEMRLQTALERLMEGRTSFVVAHRLSTIRKANQVLVLKQGEVIERGSHLALLKEGGAYARLYQQFAEATST